MNSKDQRRITRSMDQMVTRSCTADRTRRSSETQAVEDDRKQPAKKKRKVRLTRKQRHIKEIKKKKEMAEKVGLEYCHITLDERNEPWTCYYEPVEMYDLVCSYCEEFFDFIDPDKSIETDNSTNIPDRCPLCDEVESIGRPAYCYVHRRIWNDTMNECPDCED